MKANELRIGNWVEHNANWCYRGENITEFQWEDRDWYAIGECTLDLEDINPIELTEKWLLDFGFEKGYKTMDDGQYINITKDEFFVGGIDACVSGHGFIGEMKYVHQLQNLYFSLIGEELKRVDGFLNF